MKKSTISEFGTMLQTELAGKNVNINQFVWKGKNGNAIRMMDMNSDELQEIYNHTLNMLYNTDKHTPGKYQVRKNIKSLIRNCNAELFLRYILHESGVEFLKTNLQVLDLVRGRREECDLKDDDSVTTIFSSVPKEFSTVTILDLICACLNRLGIINRKMLTNNFILAQGIWLTEDEKKELTEYDEDGKLRHWKDVIRERLLLDNVRLKVNPNGFSYTEFRAIVHLAPLSKISDLPTDTLRLFRDKVFILLDSETEFNINKWNGIKENIERVAEYKDIQLMDIYSNENKE